MWDDGTTISHLRVRGATSDPLATRMRLERVLSSTTLSPSGLPAHAIVIIRRVRDPQPRRLRLYDNANAPSLAWQQAVAHDIDALVHRAARPARGDVTESAEAVLFNDRGEMLACLARDWCNGVLNTRWWWQALLRGADGARVVFKHWLQYPHYVPAAMTLLTRANYSESFVRQMPVETVHPLLANVLAAFSLTTLDFLVTETRDTASSFSPYHSRESADSPTRASPDLEQTKANPWMPWAPETRVFQHEELRRDFLGVVLMLQRAPSIIRAARFATEVRKARIETPDTYTPLYSTQTGQSPLATIELSEIAPVRNGEIPRQGTATEVDAHVTDRSQPSELVHELTQKEISIAKTGTSRHSSQFEFKNIPEQNHSMESRVFGELIGIPIQSELTAPSAMESESALEFQTAFGGVFFLINYGIFLDLYGDFTQPQRLGNALPIWDFVAVLGEALVGKKLHRDPVWRWLMGCGGREGHTVAGNEFEDLAEWRIPPEWLKPFVGETGAWHWQVRRRRIQVWHPAGFVVVDIPLTSRRYKHALDLAMKPYFDAGLCKNIARASFKASHQTSAGENWLALLVSYTRARLCLALGLKTARKIGTTLCASPARVRATATEIDIYFSLAQLPIAVRLAGLDRDPGWVPAVGRFVRFHFD